MLRVPVWTSKCPLTSLHREQECAEADSPSVPVLMAGQPSSLPQQQRGFQALTVLQWQTHS